jgi:membrane protein required for colicin V production
MLVLFAGLTPMPRESWWQQSQLVGYFTDIALWIRDIMPDDIADKFSF